LTAKVVAGINVAVLEDTKNTSKVLARFCPVIVTDMPPAVVPEVGLIEVRTGGATKLKLSELFVPLVVVILSGTVPATLAGVITPTEVSLMDVIVPGVVPKFTLVVPARPLPVIVTVSPPAVEPVVGVTTVATGPEL
jgi:hypothetical protein